MKQSVKATESILKDLTGVIRGYARMYEGKGAERDDLIQEGCLAAIRLIRDREPGDVDHAIRTSLRGMIRDASARLRRPRFTFQMSYWPENDDGSARLEDFVPDPSSADEARNAELMYDLERCLDEGEMEIAMMLLGGRTHEDVGRLFGISKQAATKRINKIRKKLEHLRPV